MGNGKIDTLKNVLKLETEGISPIGTIGLIILAVVIVLIVGIFLHKMKGVAYKRVISAMLIVAYLVIMLSLTILRRTPGSRYGFDLDINLGFGLKGHTPTVWGSAFSILNILLFVPYGILVGNTLRLKERNHMMVRTALTGFVTSALIEITQFITSTGNFELTDLLTNTFGAFIGSVIIIIFLKLRRENSK